MPIGRLNFRATADCKRNRRIANIYKEPPLVKNVKPMYKINIFGYNRYMYRL
jgi:hypothetical protein